MALTQAIIAGAKEVGKDAAGDSYQALKGYLVRRYGQHAATGIANLERHPGTREQDDLARLLQEMGAANDPQLLSQARQLIDLVENGVQADPLEQPKHKAGVRAIGQVLDAHIQWISQVRSQFSVDDSQLLSSRVASAPNIPVEVKTQISVLHDRIRGIIQQVAWNIEGGKYAATEQVTQALQGRNERERATRLVQADKAIHVSYESLRLTVGFFSELNEAILARIEQERSGQRQTQMMFGNAIMIYELADFVINFIASFALGGAAELEALHQETLRRIAKSHEDQERLAASATRDGIEAAVRDGILEDVRQRTAALDLFREEWDRYVADTKQFYARVEEVQNKIPTLELIRENARVQLNVLELVTMLRFLRANADAVRATVESLQGFRLAPLTPTRVRRLIGPMTGE